MGTVLRELASGLPGHSQHHQKNHVLDSGIVIPALIRRALGALLVTLITLLASAAAQTCDAYVSVDGKLLSGAAACYFSPPDGVQNVYVRTDILTQALGLESDYLVETGALRFQKDDLSVELLATDDVAAALAARGGALKVQGRARAGRSAILAGSSYLPLLQLIEAFGGTVGWNQTARLASVDFSASPVLMPPPEAAPVAPPKRALRPLGEPRYALHGGYTRVAIDVPAGVTYRLAAHEQNFFVLFGGARAQPYNVTPEGPQLSSLGFAEIGADGLALVAGTQYPLSAEGRGFSVGHLGGEAGGETLYIDFAPSNRGERVVKLADASLGLEAVRRPADVQKTVVIDPGHGGEDPGAVSDYVIEKDLVLEVGLKLRDELEARGINVEMTRDDDTFVELEDRANFAVPSEHNLFVSLHANATETAGAQGIETWVFGEPQDDSVIDLAVLENGGGDLGIERTVAARQEAGSIDGDLLREENLVYSTILAETVQKDLIDITGSENRGTRNNYFVVIRDARVPAVLVELGFVNHASEGPKLAQASYQETLAGALADGIEAFLSPGGTLAALQAPEN